MYCKQDNRANNSLVAVVKRCHKSGDMHKLLIDCADV